ncbi:hypothetical protein GCM10022403_048190 [Streptomyces coacervatus]|uniref:SDR family NAD(P)-dependent oxidoreductase n=1 Tax=Streptomyces coacervatus TaxID=647381 RepID=A0ABP7I456_9ACTN
MNPTYDFENKVALVTGAASGMGLATARAFAEAGAAVVPADVGKEAVKSAAGELASKYVRRAASRGPDRIRHPVIAPGAAGTRERPRRSGAVHWGGDVPARARLQQGGSGLVSS